MTKIAIDFPANFGSDRVLPIQLGRLILGHHVVRVLFTKEGQMELLIPAGAVADGSVHIYGNTEEQALHGFGSG